MKELGELQKQLQNFILGEPSAISDFIVSSAQVSEEERLDIYKEAYHLRLKESLRISFPALYSYLGTEKFYKFADNYIKKHPSSFRSIRWFGDKFALELAHYYSSDYVFLAELADFEWKMTLAFDALDQKRIQIEDMAQIAPELWADMRFRMHASVLRLNYFWNTVALWQALISDEGLPKMVKQEEVTPWILWRDSNYKINYYSLHEEEAWALDQLIAGASFQDLCEGLCQWVPVEEVALKAASYLKHWIQKGMLSELVFNRY